MVLRVAHIWNSRGNPTFWAPAIDPLWYHEAGQRIANGDWGPFPLFRAPVYPTLLGIVYSVFGPDLTAARMLNVVLQACNAWAVWRIGSAYFSAQAGVLAGLLMALNGMCIYFSCELVPACAEMLVATSVAWSSLRLKRDSSAATLAICGLAWGLAAITRPNFMLLFPLVPILLIRANAMRAAVRTVGVWSLAALLPILPVTSANYLMSREFVLIATQGGVNLWIGNNPDATGALAVLPGYGNTWQLEDAEFEAERETGKPLGPSEISAHYHRKAFAFMRENPAHAARLMIRKTALFVNRFEISNNKHITYFASLSPWLPYLIYLNFGVLIPLSVLGVWYRRRDNSAWWLALLATTYAVSVILYFVAARFRMPLVPWLCLLSALGIAGTLDLIRSGTPRNQWIAAIILIITTALVYMNPWKLSEANVSWARFMEGNAFMALGQVDSARVRFQETVQSGETLDMAHLNLGVIAYRENDLHTAKREYLLSLEANPNRAATLNNLGTVLETEGDTTGALDAYQRALTIRPLDGDARHNLAGLNFRIGVRYLKSDHDSLAIHYLRQCIDHEPSAVAYYNLAIALGRRAKQTEAREAILRALALDPEFQPAIRLRAELDRAESSTEIRSSE